MIKLRRRPTPITSPSINILLIVASILLALVVCMIPIRLAGVNPLWAYGAMFRGAYGSTNGLISIMLRATPILLTALGTTVAFRSAQWNIGGEGQIYMGALGAVIVGIFLPNMPAIIHIPLAILGGFVGGALWAFIPGFLKAVRGVNEIITTLMFSYIGVFMIQYLVDGPLQGPSAFMPQTAVIKESAKFFLIFPPYRLHAGTLLALLMVVLVYILLWKTSIGYNLRAVGFNPRASMYGGIGVKKHIVFVMLISGGLSGLAGANEVLGYHHLLIEGISPGFGFTGIIVALLGRLNPFGIIISSFLFSSLIIGANSIQQLVGIPSAIAGLMQAIVVLFVLGSTVFLEYRLVIDILRKKG